MSVSLPPVSTIVAVLTALAGVVGTILTGTGLSGLEGPIREVIAGISGILVLLPAHHATSVVAAKAKAKSAPAPKATV